MKRGSRLLKKTKTRLKLSINRIERERMRLRKEHIEAMDNNFKAQMQLRGYMLDDVLNFEIKMENNELKDPLKEHREYLMRSFLD